MKLRTLSLFAAAALLAPASFATAGSHTWDIVEVFSNADGTVQFIQLQECCGGASEEAVGGKKVTSDITGNEFTFPANLAGSTSNRSLLLATSGFASLPGAPAPDYIIPDGFFDQTGDTLRYHVYDTWAIGANAVPLDCVNSLNRDGSTGTNSPENYAGETGSVDCTEEPVCPSDIADSDGASPDGTVNLFDLLLLLDNWGTGGAGADISSEGGGAAVVDLFDLLAMLDAWGDCD